MAESNVPRMAETQYMPPTIEDVNTLGRYPFTMACLLAHVAIEGQVHTNLLREKISEFAQDETIRRPLEGRDLHGSRAVLIKLGLLELVEADPELVTKTTDDSLKRAMPVIGVFGGLQCDAPAESDKDIRPIFDFASQSAWNISRRLEFFDRVIKAEEGATSNDIRQQLGMPYTVFTRQIERFEEAGMISRERIGSGYNLLGTRIVLPDEVLRPMTNLLARYHGLWSGEGRELGASRAYAIQKNPEEFTQLLNEGIMPQLKNTPLKVPRPNVTPEQPVQEESQPLPYPEIHPDTLAILDLFKGSPLEMSYFLAHCEYPEAWLSHGVAIVRLGHKWSAGLGRIATWNRMQRARENLMASGLLERSVDMGTRLTPKGILEGIPTVSVLSKWWLGLPTDANCRKLLETGSQLSKVLTLLNTILNYEERDIASFKNEVSLSSQRHEQLTRLSEGGVIDIDRTKEGRGGRTLSIKVAPNERQFLVNLFARLRRVKTSEKMAVNATRDAMAIAQSPKSLGKIASIVWHARDSRYGSADGQSEPLNRDM